MRRLVVLAAAGLLVAAFAAPAALAGQSRIRTEVDTTLVTVGDRITMTVSVEHAPGTSVSWPDSLTLAPFEVLDAAVLPPRTVEGGTVSSVQLSVAAFELGELEIPSFEVAVIGPDDAVEVLETDRYGVEVVSVGVDEGGDIREIRGPLAIAVSTLRVGLWLVGLLALGALVFFLYRRLRSGKVEDESGERGPPPRPAHELALEALGALEGSALLERGQVKEYHIEVSDILRTYIERRFRVDALEMTTVEVLAGLESAGVDEEFRDGLRRFLEQCDLVKFAKVRPDIERSRAVLSLARQLVVDTIPAVPIPDVDVGEAEGPDTDGRGEGERGRVEAVQTAEAG